mgnify:FL=1
MKMINFILALGCAFMLGMYASNLFNRPQISKEQAYIWVLFYTTCCTLNAICAWLL